MELLAVQKHSALSCLVELSLTLLALFSILSRADQIRHSWMSFLQYRDRTACSHSILRLGLLGLLRRIHFLAAAACCHHIHVGVEKCGVKVLTARGEWRASPSSRFPHLHRAGDQPDQRHFKSCRNIHTPSPHQRWRGRSRAEISSSSVVCKRGQSHCGEQVVEP